jgi:ribonuclease G
MEALTAIDINTGRFVGKRNLEDTILKTNLAALREVATQLRLRNIGGIIIIDFIDMVKKTNRERVSNALEEALKMDRAKTNILQISELGLVEMTRKRTQESLVRHLCSPCPYCEGKAYVKSPHTVCYEVFRILRRDYPRDKKPREIVLIVHPAVADLLADEERKGLDQIESGLGCKISIKAKPDFHLEQHEIIAK